MSVQYSTVSASASAQLLTGMRAVGVERWAHSPCATVRDV